jgi:uncharacterized membrane protein
VPRANDYEPLLPWFALVLAGVLAGRRLNLVGHATAPQWLKRLEPAGSVAGSPGRTHSLALYLVHQADPAAVLYPFCGEG